MTLSDFCLVIPNRQTVAYSYMKVMDGTGSVVYSNDFTGNFAGGGESTKHKVTVNYVYENGEKAAESVTEEFSENEYYSIESVPMEGYKAENAMGKMGTEDVTVTVIYGTLLGDSFTHQLSAYSAYLSKIFAIASFERS